VGEVEHGLKSIEVQALDPSRQSKSFDDPTAPTSWNYDSIHRHESDISESTSDGYAV